MRMRFYEDQDPAFTNTVESSLRGLKYRILTKNLRNNPYGITITIKHVGNLVPVSGIMRKEKTQLSLFLNNLLKDV